MFPYRRSMWNVSKLFCGQHLQFSSSPRPNGKPKDPLNQKIINVQKSDTGANNVSRPFHDEYRKVMARVPQPVVVVTTGLPADDTVGRAHLTRGVTCSSFTSVSLNPPIVSFTMNRPSRMHDLLLKTGRFAVHVLSQQQVDIGYHFSQPSHDDQDQFSTIRHTVDERGCPVIESAVAVLHCAVHSMHHVGDHNVCYGHVVTCTHDSTTPEPLIYYARSYRSVGDDLLMRAFESRELPFSQWTHNAHLRMAWNYIQEHGLDKAIPLIKTGICEYNKKNKDKVERDYHETVTMFFIHLVNKAIDDDPKASFEQFIAKNSHLADSSILMMYYSSHLLNSPLARQRFLAPDKQPLP